MAEVTVKKVVLTGGPCGGKSTIQTMLSDVFENLGWKVFRVPETATVLLSGGVNFAELSDEQAFQFQLDLLKTMLGIEETFFNLAQSEAAKGRKCIVICDRGAMDASAYIDKQAWAKILQHVGKSEVKLRDERYDYVVHVVTAALGADEFYGNQGNNSRSEGIELARHLDQLCQHAWIGHPYFDIVDNSTNFDQKCHRVIGTLLSRLGLDDKRFGKNVEKFKFLVDTSFTMTDDFHVSYRDFTVEHRYLPTHSDGSQTRIRCRTQNGISHFNSTIRKPVTKDDGSEGYVEMRRSLSGREYDSLVLQMDANCVPIIKKRRCFLWNNRYFQLDNFVSPKNGLTILEAYFSRSGVIEMKSVVPPFIPVLEDVTSNKSYALKTISMK